MIADFERRLQEYHEGKVRGIPAEEVFLRAIEGISCRLLVTCDPQPRLVRGDIEILPWKIFLEDLWAGKIIH